MKTQTTPPPWIACHTSVIAESNNEVVCLCEPRIKTGCERANARLIAAAPELLAALKATNLFYGTSNGYEAALLRAQVGTAIAKAEGRL